MTGKGIALLRSLLIRTLPSPLRDDDAHEVEAHLRWLVDVHRARMGPVRFWSFVLSDFLRVAVDAHVTRGRLAGALSLGGLIAWSSSRGSQPMEVWNMGLLWVIAVVVATWLVALASQARRHRLSIPVILAACPVALLFLTVPTSAAFLDLVRGFQAIAESGEGGLRAIAPFCLEVVRSQTSGGMAFLATMAVAAVLQVRGPQVTADTAADGAQGAGLWTNVLLGSSALLLPVGLYALLASSVPRLIMEYTVSPDGPHALSGAGMGAASETIAWQSVSAILGGAALGVVLMALSVAVLLAGGRIAASPGLGRYSWWVLGTAMGIGVWIVGSASLDSRSFAAMLG